MDETLQWGRGEGGPNDVEDVRMDVGRLEGKWKCWKNDVEVEKEA